MSDEQPHDDIEDEQQDWRVLSAATSKNITSLPKRGEKDYEPDGTGVQSSTLDESRQAMYTALKSERKHNGKSHVKATWIPELQKARVDIARGAHFATMGKPDSTGTQWLMPEEAVYLLERGSMEMFYQDGPPMSVQAAYAACIRTSRDLERLQVYTYLKRIGFTLFPAKDTYIEEGAASSSSSLSLSRIGLGWAKHWLSRFGPPAGVACRGVYRDYPQVYKDLDVVPAHRPPHKPVNNQQETTEPFKVVYDAWKPNTPNFKKSAPGLPDFRIAVVSAQDDCMPTLAQVSAMLSRERVNKQMSKKSQAMRLKDGWRNVIVAVVDSGITSFFKLGDVGFGEEVIYSTGDGPTPNKNKKKGNNNKNKGKR